MKKLLLFASAAFYLLQIVSSCASQQPVTGGAKDTIPPTLISTSPGQKSLNFRGKELTLTFSEHIKENQLNSKLIVTPDDQNRFKATIRKNAITLEFEENFQDSTTYTLNFNSSIEDITEGNDAENVILAFSTTNYIDSLSISGIITDMLTAEALPEITVALYQATDTTHIFNKRPLYFTKTLKDGTYRLENLKRGNYRLYAFDDQNKNNLCESDIEKHGFAPDTLQLTSNLDSLNIPIIVNDVKPLEQIATRTTGSYFEARYNKSLKDYDVTVLDSSRLQQWSIYTSLTEDLRGITFYPNANPLGDSLLLSVTAIDSTNTDVTDSVYLKFASSSRKKTPFNYSVTPATQSEILPQTELQFNFNKPIIEFNQEQLSIAIDTLFKTSLIIDSVYLNDTKTNLTLFVSLDDQLIPSRKILVKKSLDSLQTDTTSAAYNTLRKIADHWSRIKDDYIAVRIPKATFISIDNDSSENILLEYKFIDSEQRGIIRGTVETEYQSYTTQLIDSKFNVVDTKSSNGQFEFKHIKPGDYTLRFLIDQNLDGQWSPGNSMLWIPPEPVLLYPEFFNVRANWLMDNIEVEL